MGVLIGGIDVAQVGVENEYRIAVLERLVELLARRGGIRISQDELSEIRQEMLLKLQEKYPSLRLQFEQTQEQ